MVCLFQDTAATKLETYSEKSKSSGTNYFSTRNNDVRSSDLLKG